MDHASFFSEATLIEIGVYSFFFQLCFTTHKQKEIKCGDKGESKLTTRLRSALSLSWISDMRKLNC